MGSAQCPAQGINSTAICQDVPGNTRGSLLVVRKCTLIQMIRGHLPETEQGFKSPELFLFQFLICRWNHQEKLSSTLLLSCRMWGVEGSTDFSWACSESSMVLSPSQTPPLLILIAPKVRMFIPDGERKQRKKVTQSPTGNAGLALQQITSAASQLLTWARPQPQAPGDPSKKCTPR